MASQVDGQTSSRTVIENVPVTKSLTYQRRLHAIVMYLLLVLIGLLVMMPLSWMLTAALRGDGEVVFTIPVSWFPTTSFHFENFWRVMANPSYPLIRPVMNTLLLVVLNVIGALFSNSLVAFAFARMRFIGRDFLFKIVILTMLMPGVVLLIPSFILFNMLGWYGTYLPLWVPSFFAAPFFVFVMRQYMRSFPRELDDAARIDGCNYWQIFWYIILPLSRPVLVVVAIFTFQGVWNDFTGPLIYLNNADKYTLQIALDYFRRSVFSGASGNTTHLVMAASLISVVPLLVTYFFVQKELIGGIASVGIKG
ncbi:MAG: carbohydrate ABC transporter permease [Chloroflexi bacterium]|nr:MAG: carbohydrate ABC transporter permease [Chloroflexota bacterium]